MDAPAPSPPAVGSKGSTFTSAAVSGVPIVRFDGVSKRFPGVRALESVSFDIQAGSCHALCGENGAGKSTLAKILAGIQSPDGGRLFVLGREGHFHNPHE